MVRVIWLAESIQSNCVVTYVASGHKYLGFYKYFPDTNFPTWTMEPKQCLAHFNPYHQPAPWILMWEIYSSPLLWIERSLINKHSRNISNAHDQLHLYFFQDDKTFKEHIVSDYQWFRQWFFYPKSRTNPDLIASETWIILYVRIPGFQWILNQTHIQ